MPPSTIRLCLFALLAAIRACPAGEAASILREEPWSCYFAGREIALHYLLTEPGASTARVTWSLAVEDQVVRRGESAVTAAPGRLGRLELRLALPEARPGTVISATVALAADGGPRLTHPLWIFPEDPLADRRRALEEMKIVLFDPVGTTARVLQQSRVPVRSVRDVSALAATERGTIVIGEGVSLNQWRTLGRTMIETAARGVPVLCLAPAEGSLPMPGLGGAGLPQPSGFFLRQADVITSFDKRLDTHWPPDGKATAAAIEVASGRSGITGEISAGDRGWPWLELTFPAGRTRLVVCGLAIISKWDAEPTPRYLLVHLLDHVSRSGGQDR